MSSCNIKVIARFRPYNENEKKNKDKASHSEFDLDFVDGCRVEMKIDKQSYSFTYDIVFDPDTRQEELYESAAKPSIDDILDGYNSTIFAYGQTGSGKSFTMFGIRHIEELRGIIPRASRLDTLESDQRDLEYAIKCAFLEIYKEKIHDLLSPNPKDTSLKVRESPNKGVWVDGLHEEFIASEDEIAELLNVGEAARTVSATDMNARSSRSHSVFMIIVEQKAADGSVKSGKLNLVDLAGSERVAKTNVNAKQLDEAKDINKSLSCLGKCIHSLSEAASGKKGIHIPYRESQLTRILQESLGGNTKTALVITCSPAVYNADETLSTLRFGASAKTIKNIVTVNQKRSVEEMELLLKNLQKELASLRAYAKKLEQQIGITGTIPSPVLSAPVSIPENKTIESRKREELSMNLNLSPRPGSAPLRSRATSGPPPVSGPRFDLAPTTDNLLPIDIEIEEYNPMALAELSTKYQELEQSSESTIEQLKIELQEVQAREANIKFELTQSQEKLDKANQKIEATRTKAAQDHTEFSLKIQQLEETLREKTEEADESIIVLYADNERLEQQVQEMTQKNKLLQLGQLQSLRQSFLITSSSDLTQKPPETTDSETANVGVEGIQTPLDIDRKIVDLEEQLLVATKKLRAAEDKEITMNKKINAQKESQLSEVTAKNSVLQEEKQELINDKTALEKELEDSKAALKAADQKYAEQVKSMEKMLQKRARLFKPIKKKNDPNEAMKEKIDLSSHISGLKKTQSPFLEMARKDHERSQMTRGELLFGIKQRKTPEQQREEYKALFTKMDKDGSGTIDVAELGSSLKRLGRNVPEDEIQKLMIQLDKDGNGVVDFDEFYLGMTMIAHQPV